AVHCRPAASDQSKHLPVVEKIFCPIHRIAPARLRFPLRAAAPATSSWPVRRCADGGNEPERGLQPPERHIECDRTASQCWPGAVPEISSTDIWVPSQQCKHDEEPDYVGDRN